MGTNYIIDSIDIEDVNGTLPFSVYVCDEFFNNCQLLYTITDPVYWPVQITIPETFNGAGTLVIKIVDSQNCETFKVITCN